MTNPLEIVLHSCAGCKAGATTPEAFAVQPMHQFIDKVFDVETEPDVIYGRGGVGYGRGRADSQSRDLALDIYRPKAAFAPRPALIMAFGGAFHRGSKSAEVFEGENPSTAVAEYCREFARRGYVCFSIDYRLMQEDPDPGDTPFLPPGQALNRDRIDHVRRVMGLSPSTPEMMANTLEAATDDMSRAVAFVRTNAEKLGVDTSRIAIGGFSAGAIIALSSAFAERAPVAAVVSLSGRIAVQTLEKYTRPADTQPAVLYVCGEHDLPAILGGVEETRAFMSKAKIDAVFAKITAANHFYLRSASALLDTGDTLELESLMAVFLSSRLRLSEVAPLHG